MHSKDKKITTRLSADLFTRVKTENDVVKIDAEGVHYRHLNAILRALDGNGVRKIELHNVYGQRYIGIDLDENIEIHVYGTPGNDLGAFMNSPNIFVHGNVQDGCGNTMNGGLIAVHGYAGDVTGYSMRKGKIFIRGNVGYRAGIHMKGFRNIMPYMVIGGVAHDFLGEYMAGGAILVLGLNQQNGEHRKAKFVGTGMHGGAIYVRGKLPNTGKEVEITDPDKNDMELIRSLVKEFCGYFNFDFDAVMSGKFSKIAPVSYRPYGRLYAN